MSLFDIALLFLRTGVVSFGGGSSVIADLQHELVDRSGAITRDQFFTAFAIGQATPGPGILYLVPLGYYAAGVAGAAVAFVSFMIPPMLLQIVMASRWERMSGSPWIRATDRALIPISVGLIGASLFSLGGPMLASPVSVVGIVVAALIGIAFRPTPSLVVLAGGVLGLLGLFG
jgi:chromate transporter